MRKQIGILVLMLSVFSGQAVSQSQESPVQVTHQATGKVVALDRDKSTIRIAHDAIPSLGWPGMTMNFGVAKSPLPDGLKAGDAVRFELRQFDSKKWEIFKIERR
jgi:Cu/Ag efflux protein CusF